MPAATIATARDEMYGRLKATLDASAYATIVVAYDDARQDQPGDDKAVPVVPAGKPWLRASVRHADGGNASLGGVNGKKRQEMLGVITVQVFTPAGDGLKDSDAIVEVILNGYRTGGATPSGVQFTKVRPQEVGKDGLWFQVNCLIDFTYDQIK